jgi:general secretion pathway protein C
MQPAMPQPAVQSSPQVPAQPQNGVQRPIAPMGIPPIPTNDRQ